MNSVNLKRITRSDIANMKPYIAVTSLSDIDTDKKPGQIIKLDSGENQFGCSPMVIEALASDCLFNFYPDSEYKQLRISLATYTRASADNIMVGSGSDELLDLLFRLILNPGDQVINCPPTFGMYEAIVKLNRGSIVSVPRLPDFSLDMASIQKALTKKVKIIIICTPNNPTGTTTPTKDILALLQTNKIIVVDEAYFEFSNSTVAPLIAKYPNLIVLRTLSKWAGLAGLRLGYGIMNPFFVEQLLKIKPPYNVNSAAVIAGVAALSDEGWKKKVTVTIINERKRVRQELQKMPVFEVFSSEANFLFIKTKKRFKELKTIFEKNNILVRYYDSLESLRVTIGTPRQNNKVISACNQFFSLPEPASIIFDMDGVLIDVTKSYRQAILLSANYLLNDTKITADDVDKIKAIPGFNNDWDATYTLYTLAKQNKLKSSWQKLAVTMLPVNREDKEFQQLFKVFQTYYLGSKLFMDTYQEKSPFNCVAGLIEKEKCLINPTLLRQLVKMGYKVAIATGRPKSEALTAIKFAGLTPYFTLKNLVALEDVVQEKPNPEPLLLAQKMINSPKSVYVGDTLNDQIAARAAKMDFYFIATNTKKDSFSTVNSFLQWFISR